VEAVEAVELNVFGRVAPATVIAKIAEEIPQIVECYRMTGEDCFYFTMHLRAVAELEPILDRFTPYGHTTTSLVQTAPVPRRPLPVE
jgi:Lrp/AsnC family leucine-responsive transcriptional regulator